MELVKRNIKMFFSDKGMFFTSLITPIILLVLFFSFLGKIYVDSYLNMMPEGIEIDSSLIHGLVGGQLLSSMLAVCCVTIAFCSNLLMVQDKVTGARKDLTVAPIKKSILSLSYYIASFLSTLIICFVALLAGFAYLAFVGWYLSFVDVLKIMLDVVLLVMFGTALSSLVNYPLFTSGQGSAVGTIVSSGYGFICGAYMPIASFSPILQNILSFLPSTYGTSLLKNHCTDSTFKALLDEGVPKEIIETMSNFLDCNIYFFDHQVSILVMYLILIGSTLLLVGLYIFINKRAKRV